MTTKLRPQQRVADIYVCEQLLATGGMAEVWSVRHEAMGAHFALKTPTSGAADVVAMFHREANILARLSHRNVVRLLDYAALADGSPFLVMEWARGPTVLDLLRDTGPIQWRRAMSLVRQLLDTLAAVHACGVVHRDIKPANLVVAEEQPERLRLIDFGIACPSRQPRRRGRTRVVAGTPGFIAPEVVAGDASDERSDLYAVGAVLAAMVYGHLNCQAPTQPEPPVRAVREALAQCATPPPSLAESIQGPDPLPAAVRAYIATLMELDPALRPANCADALRLLPDVTSPASAAPSTGDPSRQYG